MPPNPDLLLATRRSIEQAFPVSRPPHRGDLLSPDLQHYDPFVAEELTRELRGRKWTDLSDQFVLEHPDWLVYLSPGAFVYYLPAYLVYALDYDRADYAGFWTVSFFNGQPVEPGIWKAYTDVLSPVQREAIVQWYEYLRQTYPSEIAPPEHGSFLDST